MPGTWNELVRVALIGTDRVKLSPDLFKKLKALGISTNKDSAEVVLEGASFYSLMQRTGGFLKPWKGNFPDADQSADSKPCSAQSAYHLTSILSGHYEIALPEFIHYLSQNKKCLPPELLPDLLDRCKTSAVLWEKIRPTIGARGDWLIRQNPYWEKLIQSPEPDHWKTENPNQRLALLQNTRTHNPLGAIQLIQSTWREDSLPQRVSFIKLLENHLSLKDEKFLESCLNDGRKEIRSVAADLLAKLPDSKLVKRTWENLQSLITTKKALIQKGNLEITLPEEITDEMIRDGIDPGAQWYNGGVKASRLGQLVAVIPPKKWEAFFNKPAEEVLQIFINSNSAELMLQAIIEAVYRHKDRNWIEAIFNFWRDNQGQQRWITFDPKKLLPILPADSFNKLAILSLEKKDKLMDENSPITNLLKVGLFPWEDQLTRLVIKNMQDWIGGETARYWSGWHLHSILRQAAYFCNPNLLEELQQGWAKNSGIWASWEREIQQFLSILKFRKEMIEELNLR